MTPATGAESGQGYQRVPTVPYCSEILSHVEPTGEVGTPWYPSGETPAQSTNRADESKRALDFTDDETDPFPRGDPAEWAAITTDPLAVLFDLFERSRPAWHDQAACRGSGVDFTATGRKERARAFDICGRCPVRAECLEWAIEVGDEVAVLGGMDPAARRRMGQS